MRPLYELRCNGVSPPNAAYSMSTCMIGVACPFQAPRTAESRVGLSQISSTPVRACRMARSFSVKMRWPDGVGKAKPLNRNDLNESRLLVCRFGSLIHEHESELHTTKL